MAKIMMPVTTLGDGCVNCPELDIDVDKIVGYVGGPDPVITANDLHCKHYSKCLGIYNQVKKDWEENNVTKLNADHA